MKIVVEFNDFEEMSGFCEEMIRKKADQAKEKLNPETKKVPKQLEATSPVEEPSISTHTSSTPAPATVEKAKVTLQDVTTKAVQLIDAGRQEDLQALLSKYGVPSIPDLFKDKPNMASDFLEDLEVLG